MGLSETATPPSTVEAVNYITNSEVTPYVPSDVTSLMQQIEDLTQKVNESETKCGKLTEACRDKDLKLDLLETEVRSLEPYTFSPWWMNITFDRESRTMNLTFSGIFDPRCPSVPVLS